ncbi:MAG: starch-binding protein, partial [Lachnospiraceae bacterium]|nr:starch-binding protein [Lachnospiraceae bacterium]
MERKNRLNRKKRNIGNSMLSFILVFAMVFTNVQPSLITVQAAESETAVFDETAQSSEIAQADDELKTENNEDSQTGNDETEKIKETTEPSETVKSNETEETSETVKPSETEASSETVKSSETEQPSETVKPSETEEAGETTESSETVETTTETEEVTETAETETETEADTEQITADAEETETVTVKVHFRNEFGWEKVNVYYWADGKDNGWPGVEVTEKDQDGCYVVELSNKKTAELGIIFNDSEGSQTGDIIIPVSEFTDDICEFWVFLDDNGFGTISKTLQYPFVSPEIEKNTVTFRYKNDKAETVLVAGSMNNWTQDPESEDAFKMVKGEDGIFTYKTKLQRGSYQYKFIAIVNGEKNWTCDPGNDKPKEGGNSVINIETLLSP